MPLPDEIAQALDEQRMTGLEKTRVELIAKALQLPEQTVARVVHAEYRLNEALTGTPLDDIGKDETLMIGLEFVSDKLRDAITHAMKQGAMRLLLRYSMTHRKPITVYTEDLLTFDKREDLCNGCPERLPCIADSLHTATQCYTGRKSMLQVYPVRVTKTHVEVDAAQPAGRHLIPFSKLQTRIKTNVF